jgi:mannitol/fructose-specific phosphotransferase system IIA component (Ntr-type)
LLLNLETLAKTASTVVILSYILTNFSLIVLREAKLRNYRPSFRVPLYPVLPIVNIVLFSILIFDMGQTAWQVGLGLICVGVLIYVFYGRYKAQKEYALIHLVERIINKKLTSHSLETELRQIITERDEVVHDRFDKLVSQAKIIDLGDLQKKEKVFRHLAEEAADLVALSADEIERLINEREEESSTAISPFLAIPHVILEGENKFKLMIARSAKGIYFSEKYSAVKAVFLLMGTRDERQFHLQVLAAIAQAMQDKSFEKLWNAAETSEHLRDVILLSKRARQ